MRPILIPMALAALGACAPTVPSPADDSRAPLQQLPADAALTEVRNDLIASANAKFGSDALRQAMAAPAYLVVKRFAGMVPPPPPGSDPDWRPPTPTALLMRGADGWQSADGAGWTRLSAAASAQIDLIIADRRFWSEAATVQACPDYGASNLILKVPGRPETVRNAMCTSRASDLVSAALGG